LFVGSEGALLDPKVLEELNIKAVLGVGAQVIWPSA
jgi:hypothetical protein